MSCGCLIERFARAQFAGVIAADRVDHFLEALAPRGRARRCPRWRVSRISMAPLNSVLASSRRPSANAFLPAAYRTSARLIRNSASDGRARMGGETAEEGSSLAYRKATSGGSAIGGWTAALATAGGNKYVRNCWGPEVVAQLARRIQPAAKTEPTRTRERGSTRIINNSSILTGTLRPASRGWRVWGSGAGTRPLRPVGRMATLDLIFVAPDGARARARPRPR